MEIVEAEEFLKHNHQGVLVARKRDGSLQMTLVSSVIDGQGRVILTARERTYKVKNIRRN
ncbi:MAG: PPOX class F420-dependent oxidoreductase, partial [Verrucomicrobia bacterium]